MTFVLANWEYFLLAFWLLEKIVKITPWKWDDVFFDMVLKPLWGKFLAKKTA